MPKNNSVLPSRRWVSGFWILAAALCFSVGYPMPAEAGSEVRVILESSPLDGWSGESDHHLFGNRDAKLTFRVFGNLCQKTRLRARLIQLSSSLGVPLGFERDVTGQLTPEGGPAQGVQLVIPLPRVDRETVIGLQFSAQKAGEKEWRVGEFRLRLYPSALLDPLSQWAGKNSVRVRDRHGMLSKVLRAQNVRFLEVQPDQALLTEGEALAILADDRPEALRAVSALKEGQGLIWLNSRPTSVPKIVVVSRDRGTLVTVEGFRLDQMDADPRLQKLLMEAVVIAQTNLKRGE